MSNQFDPKDKEQARAIWYKHRKKQNGELRTVRDIWKLIADAAEKGMWDIGKRVGKPTENTVRSWIKKDWAPTVMDLPEDKIVGPWDDDWGPDPARVRTLLVLFDLAGEIWKGEKINDQGMGPKFPGFPKLVCDWACKLSGFFDLQLKCECLVLLHFAYVFAADDQYSNTFGPPMTFQDESSKMLMRWHKRHQEPDLTEKLREREGVVVIPLWEQDDWSVAEDVVARHLLPMAWVLPPLNMGEVSMETVNREYETIYQANLGPEEND